MNTKIYIFSSIVILFLLVISIVLISLTKNKSSSTIGPVPTETIMQKEIDASYQNYKPPVVIQENQTKSDFNFGQKQSFIKQNYPWYSKLPLTENNYYVYFDVDLGKFIIKIYADQNAAVAIKKTILDKLQNMGVDLNTFPYDVQIIP